MPTNSFRKPLLFLFLIILFLGGAVMLKDAFRKEPKASRDILYLTQPIISFSGKIEKISGNTLWVSQRVTMAQAPEQRTINPSPIKQSPRTIPTPLFKTITLKVTVTDATQISRPTPSVPYLFTTPTPPSSLPTLSISDLAVGQSVSVTTNTDLRMFSADTVEATSIQLSLISNVLSGTIVSVRDNTITLKATPAQVFQPTPQAAKEATYTIVVTTATEISHYLPSQDQPPKPLKPERLSLSDLKPDMQVTVYTDGDVTTQTQLKALRIEPQIINDQLSTTQ